MYHAEETANLGDISNKDGEGFLEKIKERAAKRLSEKTITQYISIITHMNDKEWHKTSEMADILGLKETRTKELLKELAVMEILEDSGKTKGKMYRLK